MQNIFIETLTCLSTVFSIYTYLTYFRELPPVLNLQLNRFQFDMQYNRKKKLNSALFFPDVLDMADYLEDKTKVSNRYRYQPYGSINGAILGGYQLGGQS